MGKFAGKFRIICAHNRNDRLANDRPFWGLAQKKTRESIMRESLQRNGAATLGFWVLANIILFLAKTDFSIVSAAIVFFVGIFIGTVLIALVVVNLQTILAYIFVPGIRNINGKTDWETLEKKRKLLKRL